MGNLNCSCIKNNDNGQIIFENGSNNKIENEMIQKKSFFEIIEKYYNSKNIEVKNITKEEFFEIFNSDKKITKILEEYEEIFDKYNINFELYNNKLEYVKFIDNNENKEFSHFYYFGEFNENGIIDGFGIKILQKNYIYKGEFTNGEYNGKGLLIKNTSSIFGDWENGVISGNVIYKIISKFEYMGNFEANKKNGYGTEKYPDGSIYEGNFIDNKKNGHGIYSFPNNEYYEGNFENDLYNGEGQYIWGKTGKKYNGEFKNGKIEGKGIYTYGDGTIFKGTFVDGYKNGEGYIQFPDGKKYFGNWLNDELYGNGYLINGNKKIEIVFRHGKIISQKIEDEIEEETKTAKNYDDLLGENNNARFKINSFFGDRNTININKYICLICKSFFVYPLQCSICNTDYCKECIKDKKCQRCKNNQFINDKGLFDEMKENIKIKCDKCEKILKYEESFSHFH